MKNPHIILLDDGKVWAFEPPEKPEYCIIKSPSTCPRHEDEKGCECTYLQNTYDRAYSLALEQKIEVENPEEVFQVLYGNKKMQPLFTEKKIKENEPIKWEGSMKIQHQIYETSGKWVDTHELMYSKFPDDRRRKLVRLIAPVKEEKKLSENDVIAGVERMLSESQNNVDSDQKKKGSENTPTPEEMADWDRPKSKPVPSEQEKQRQQLIDCLMSIKLLYTHITEDEGPYPLLDKLVPPGENDVRLATEEIQHIAEEILERFSITRK